MPVSAATVTQYYTGIFRQAPSPAVSSAYQAMANDAAALNSMLSAANVQVDPVVRLYQTAFNRVPDSAGMTAWTVPFSSGAITLQAIANGFTQSTEFTALYPTSMSNAQFVGALYYNILQRTGEDAGIKGWVDALNKGALTRAQVLLGFSDSAEFIAKIEPNVNAFLTAAANNTQTYTGNLFDQGGSIAVTKDLTTGADSPLLAAANDLINGTVTSTGQLTWQTWDTLNGGSGNDTLTADMNGNTVTMTNVTSVEKLNLNVFTAAATINAANANYIQSITVNDAAGLTINSLGSLPSISLSGSTANGTTLNFIASALEPAAQTLNITLAGKTGAAALTISDIGSNTLETVAIASTGAANTLGGLTTSGIGATTLNITGDQNLTLGAITDANATLRTVNAGAATGNVSLTVLASTTFTGGAGNDTVTSSGGVDNFTGGAGNDTFAMGANLTALDTVAGGDGTADTLSGTSAALTAFTAAAPTTNVSGIESITMDDALGGNTLLLSAIQAGINDVNLGTVAAAAQAGTVTFDSGVAGNIDVGTAALASTLGAITVTVAGTATTDAATIDNDTANIDIWGGNVVTTGVETLTLDGTTTTAAALQTPDVVTMTASTGGTTTVNFIGNNSFAPAGVITAGTINASGLTVNLLGAQTALTMTAGANTATTIVGSAGADILLDNNAAATAVSIDGGAGNDTITTNGAQNDTLRGGEGADTITAATGNDNIDGGAGNDVVEVATGEITANDTVSGGDGTADVLSYATFVAGTDNVVAAQSRVSNFEVLRMAGAAGAGVAVTLTNYISNTGFTEIQLGTSGAGANGYAFANASSSLNTITARDAAGGVAGTHTFARLVDTSADAITIQNASTGAGLAQTITALTVNDEETITISATTPTNAGANDLTITTLNASDLVTLNIAGGANDVIITNAIVGSTNLATVNASTSTGAVTVNASAGTALTMTGNSASAAVTTFTGGAFGDVITGGGGADVLDGGAGRDTISGGAGADAITGGAGADSMTGGAAADTFAASVSSSVVYSAVGAAGATFANGDTLTFGNGVDVITDFVSGTDRIDATTTGGASLASLVGATIAGGAGNAPATNYWVAGTYVNGVFTINNAATASTANVAVAYIDHTADAAFATSAGWIILTGIATIAAADIV